MRLVSSTIMIVLLAATFSFGRGKSESATEAPRDQLIAQARKEGKVTFYAWHKLAYHLPVPATGGLRVHDGFGTLGGTPRVRWAVSDVRAETAELLGSLIEDCPEEDLNLHTIAGTRP